MRPDPPPVGRPDLAAVRARLARLRAEPSCARGPARLRERVGRVVVVASSSRGGSSIFAELLRRAPGLLHLRAELNPFLTLAGLGWPESGRASDALDADVPPELLDAVGAELSLEAGNPTDALLDAAAEDAFAVELAVRLTLQWPALDVSLDRVRAALADTLAALRRDHGWAPGTFPDAALFHAAFLARLRSDLPGLTGHAYDLPRALVTRFDPAAPAFGPPTAVIEEPPFVPIGPWRLADDNALATRPLVVKTPSNAYRLPFLRALFPNAALDVLHLTRNVAASVNGLFDGWRFPGFHAHRLERPLAITGYDGPGADRWWKFDLPPGWGAWTDRPLAEVCAFQWRAAHRHTLAFLDATGTSSVPVRFEDVVGPEHRQTATFEALGRRLDVNLSEPLRAAVSGALPPVMSTTAPRRRRWFARAELLAPVLVDPENLALMERLGHAADPDTWL